VGTEKKFRTKGALKKLGGGAARGGDLNYDMFSRQENKDREIRRKN